MWWSRSSRSLDCVKDSRAISNHLEEWTLDSKESAAGEQPAGEWAARQAEGFASRASQESTESGDDKDFMDLALDKLAQLRDGGFEQLRSDVIKYTREQPMTALLVAAGAGLLIGMLGVLGRRQSETK